MKNLICIGCPRGCHLSVDEETLAVSGNFCEKGEEYGKNELTNPLRTVTGTVRCSGAAINRLPVRTNRPVPKEKILEVMAALHAFEAKAPIKLGEVLITGVAGTDSDIISTRTLSAAE